MPPVPKSPQPRRPGTPKSKGAVRAKSGCYTCRIRRKKCDEKMNDQGSCSTCERLRLQCLGFGAKRPEWLRENRNVRDLREKIKTFLASQGMIKGHSGTAPRAPEQEPQILALSAEYTSPDHSPQTPTLSISSTSDERPSSYPLRADRYPDNDRKCSHLLFDSLLTSSQGLILTQHESPDSPLDRNDSFHEVLLPVPYSSTVNTSIDSWPNQSLALQSCQRPHISDFSRHSNFHYLEDLPHDAVSSAYLLSPELAYNQSLPTLDSHQNDSLGYYMTHVLRLQYPHAGDSLGPFIWQLIHASDNARHAACLLSDLHRRSMQQDRFGFIQPDDVESISIINFQNPLTEGDALAGLCLVSYFLFRGGKGRWQTFLDTACTFSLSVLKSYGDPREVLYRCSESLRFIIKTSIWFDVLASATLMREPRFLDIIQDLFGPQSAYFGDDPVLSMAEYSMLSVMGCESHIVHALAQIASLAHWKDVQLKDGSLSVIELVKRGRDIEGILKKPSSSPSSIMSPEETRADQRRKTSEVFRASAHVYLHSVVSGDFPRCPEIIEAVNETVRCLKRAEEGPTGRAVVRSVVFSICICGCLTDNQDHRRYFLQRLQEQRGLPIGNSQQVSNLIQDVWKERSRGATVDWRHVMRKAEMLLV